MKHILLLFLALPCLSAHAENTTLPSCRLITSMEERVSCYDNYVDRFFPQTASPQTELKPVEDLVSRPELGTNTAVTPTAESLFGKDQAESKRIVEETLEIKKIDQIQARVVKVTKSSYKKLTVTLEGGQIWRQLDSKPMLIRKGDVVLIRAAKLGSFLMQKQSANGSIRVKRVN